VGAVINQRLLNYCVFAETQRHTQLGPRTFKPIKQIVSTQVLIARCVTKPLENEVCLLASPKQFTAWHSKVIEPDLSINHAQLGRIREFGTLGKAIPNQQRNQHCEKSRCG